MSTSCVAIGQRLIEAGSPADGAKTHHGFFLIVHALILGSAEQGCKCSDRKQNEPRGFRLNDPRYYPMDGARFVMRYADVSSMTVVYVGFKWIRKSPAKLTP